MCLCVCRGVCVCIYIIPIYRYIYVIPIYKGVYIKYPYIPICVYRPIYMHTYIYKIPIYFVYMGILYMCVCLYIYVLSALAFFIHEMRM